MNVNIRFAAANLDSYPRMGNVFLFVFRFATARASSTTRLALVGNPTARTNQYQGSDCVSKDMYAQGVLTDLFPKTINVLSKSGSKRTQTGFKKKKTKKCISEKSPSCPPHQVIRDGHCVLEDGECMEFDWTGYTVWREDKHRSLICPVGSR